MNLKIMQLGLNVSYIQEKKTCMFEKIKSCKNHSVQIIRSLSLKEAERFHVFFFLLLYLLEEKQKAGERESRIEKLCTYKSLFLLIFLFMQQCTTLLMKMHQFLVDIRFRTKNKFRMFYVILKYKFVFFLIIIKCLD